MFAAGECLLCFASACRLAQALPCAYAAAAVINVMQFPQNTPRAGIIDKSQQWQQKQEQQVAAAAALHLSNLSACLSLWPGRSARQRVDS